MTESLKRKEAISYHKRKRIAIISVLIMLAIVITGISVSRVYADGEESSVVAMSQENISKVESKLTKLVNGETIGVNTKTALSMLTRMRQGQALSDTSKQNLTAVLLYISGITDVTSATAITIINDVENGENLDFLSAKLTISKDDGKTDAQKNTYIQKLDELEKESSSSAPFNVPVTLDTDLISDSDLVSIISGLDPMDTFNSINNILSSGFYEKMIASDEAPGRIVLTFITWLAIGIALIYGIINTIRIVSRDEANLDMIRRIAATFIISFLCIFFADKIAGLIDNLGQQVVIGVEGSLSEKITKSDIDSVLEEYKNSYMEYDMDSGQQYVASSTGQDVFSSIKSFFVSIVLSFITQILVYSICCCCFGLYFAFCMRRVFLPLAVASVSIDGFRSPGIQYLISYFGLYIEMAYFYVVAYAASLMENYAVNNASTAAALSNTVFRSLGAILCIRAAARTALSKSGEFAQKVVGVR